MDQSPVSKKGPPPALGAASASEHDYSYLSNGAVALTSAQWSNPTEPPPSRCTEPVTEEAPANCNPSAMCEDDQGQGAGNSAFSEDAIINLLQKAARELSVAEAMTTGSPAPAADAPSSAIGSARLLVPNAAADCATLSHPQQCQRPRRTIDVDSSSAASAEDTKSFLRMLFDIISSSTHAHIISWLPDGVGFVIADQNRFTGFILPEFFDGIKFNSFTRRLKRWSFVQVPQGDEMRAWYNHKFVRGRPDLIHEIKYTADTLFGEAKKKAVGNVGPSKSLVQSVWVMTRESENQEIVSPRMARHDDTAPSKLSKRHSAPAQALLPNYDPKIYYAANTPKRRGFMGGCQLQMLTQAAIPHELAAGPGQTPLLCASALPYAISCSTAPYNAALPESPNILVKKSRPKRTQPHNFRPAGRTAVDRASDEITVTKEPNKLMENYSINQTRQEQLMPQAAMSLHLVAGQVQAPYGTAAYPNAFSIAGEPHHAATAKSKNMLKVKNSKRKRTQPPVIHRPPGAAEGRDSDEGIRIGAQGKLI